MFSGGYSINKHNFCRVRSFIVTIISHLVTLIVIRTVSPGRPFCISCPSMRRSPQFNILVQLMACRLFGAMPLPLPVWPLGKKLQSKYHDFQSRKSSINNNASLVYIMGWHQTGDKSYLNRCCLNLLTHVSITRPRWVKETLNIS